VLSALRERLTTCIGCGCLSIDRCELLNPDDEAAAQGPGAHYLTAEGPRG
jgi:MerR family redox-sensitive transcriptional activator SoxR